MPDDSKLRKLMRQPAVLAASGYSRSTLWLKIKERKFPAPHKLDDEGRAVAWFEDEVIAWQKGVAQRQFEAA